MAGSSRDEKGSTIRGSALLCVHNEGGTTAPSQEEPERFHRSERGAMKAQNGNDGLAAQSSATVGQEFLPAARRQITLLAGRTAPFVDHDSFPCRRSA
jgi:hypothetical protein